MSKVSAYDLACGAVRSQYAGRVNITLWSEFGVYHVRAHDHENRKRLWWNTYRTFKVANRQFERAVNVLTAKQEKRDADAWADWEYYNTWRPKVRILNGKAVFIEPDNGG